MENNGKDCIFCKNFREKKLKIIFETDNSLLFLDRNPISKWHCLLIPKVHYNNIFDCDKKVLSYLFLDLKFFLEKYKIELKFDSINDLNASWVNSQQSINHLHFHIIPRYENDWLDLWVKNNNS